MIKERDEVIALLLKLRETELDTIAKKVRQEWSDLSRRYFPNPPPAFTKSWEETNEFGREGNRASVVAVIDFLIGRLENE